MPSRFAEVLDIQVPAWPPRNFLVSAGAKKTFFAFFHLFLIPDNIGPDAHQRKDCPLLPSCPGNICLNLYPEAPFFKEISPCLLKHTQALPWMAYGSSNFHFQTFYFKPTA